MRTIALVALVACGTENASIPDAVHHVVDVRVDGRSDLPDDGFGFACKTNPNDTKPTTPCYADSGLEGICDVAVCRRICPGGYPQHGCPNGQYGEPIAGDPGCICVPRMCTETNARADTRDRLALPGDVSCYVTETGL